MASNNIPNSRCQATLVKLNILLQVNKLAMDNILNNKCMVKCHNNNTDNHPVVYQIISVKRLNQEVNKLEMRSLIILRMMMRASSLRYKIKGQDSIRLLELLKLLSQKKRKLIIFSTHQLFQKKEKKMLLEQ